MTPWIDATMGIAAAGLCVVYIRQDVRAPWVTYTLGVLVAACALTGGSLSALLAAAGFGLRRIHPLLPPLPALAAAYWLDAPVAGAVLGAWMLAGAGPWWAGLATLAILAPAAPLHAVVAVPLGLGGNVLAKHPSNGDLHRLWVRVAPWMLPLPAAVLFLLSALGRATGDDERLLQFTLMAIVAAVTLSLATAGLALRFIAADGLAGPWTAAVATAVVSTIADVAVGTLRDAWPATGALLVAAAITAAPAVSRLGRLVPRRSVNFKDVGSDP